MGVIEVTGKDRAAFLNRMLSNEVANLKPGNSIPACVLTEQAKIISRLDVMCFDNHFKLLLPQTLVSRVIEKLSSVIIMDDVTLKEGDRSGTVPDLSPLAEVSRIEAGIPMYGVDYDETNNPLEVRLDETVSFAKGCFPGQEILARLDSRGGVSKKLVGLKVEGKDAPEKGSVIQKDGKEIGKITSAVYSPTRKKTIALGMLKKNYWEIGNNMQVTLRNVVRKVTVAAFPLD